METMRLLGVSVLVASLAVTSGCDPAEGDDAEFEDYVEMDDEVTYRQLVDNGVELNGINLNGIRFNGIRFNGIRFNGVILNLVSLLENVLGSVTVNGSLITAINTNTGAALVGGQLIGTEFSLGQIVIEGGQEIPEILKITGMAQSSAFTDTYFNTVMRKTGSTWESLCRDNYDQPVEAIALKDDWDAATGARLNDPNALTWGCRGTALAKCVEWGYRPWATQNGTSLKDYHQACTRMVRADYCGLGNPTTVNGTPIDMADGIGLQSFEASTSGWQIEAKWGPNGAVCLNHTRKLAWSTNPLDPNYIGCNIPACTNSNVNERGALIMNKSVRN